MFVRLAIPSDETELLEMAAAASAETFPHLRFSVSRARATIRRSMTDHMPVFFVVEGAHRELIAFQVALWGESDFTDAEIVEQRVIFVRPEHRGSEAAALLLRHLDDWSVRLGAHELYVNVGSGRRQRATARYVRRFGFEEIGSVLRKTRVGP